MSFFVSSRTSLISIFFPASDVIICSSSELSFVVSRLVAFSSSGRSTPFTMPVLIFDSTATIILVAGLKILSIGFNSAKASEFAKAKSASLS